MVAAAVAVGSNVVGTVAVVFDVDIATRVDLSDLVLDFGRAVGPVVDMAGALTSNPEEANVVDNTVNDGAVCGVADSVVAAVSATCTPVIVSDVYRSPDPLKSEDAVCSTSRKALPATRPPGTGTATSTTLRPPSRTAMPVMKSIQPC